MGVPGDVVVRRGEPIPLEPATGPIYISTRNDDLDAIVEATPPHRREDLVFMQNGMLGKFLDSKGLSANTQILLYLAVAKLGEKPIDGITEYNPEGLTAATGKWAGACRAARKGRSQVSSIRWRSIHGRSAREHVWICSSC